MLGLIHLISAVLLLPFFEYTFRVIHITRDSGRGRSQGGGNGVEKRSFQLAELKSKKGVSSSEIAGT